MNERSHRVLTGTGTALLLSLLCMTAAYAQRFNIGTYNLRYANHGDSLHGNGWGQRLPVIAAQVRFHDFDIFGTQEGLDHMLEGLRDSLPDYAYIGIGRDDGKQAGEHSAIFYKTNKFKLLEHGDFWLSEITDRPNKGWDAVLPRICTWGKFRETGTGFIFYMFNLHMDHVGVQARAESAKMILAKIKTFPASMPVILTGDFNVDQTSESYKLINNSGVLRDCYELSPIRLATNGTFNNFHTDGKTDSRIDHIFVTRQFRVARYGILTDTYCGRTPSDHFPVEAQVEFGALLQQVEHVVLITIDGLRPNLYMDPSWNTVHLHQLMKDGAYAEGVNSVFPSMTYPSHATIVTGVQPAKHGVYFNNMFEPNGPTGKMYWNDSSIHSPTVWDAAEKKGMKVAALLWPVSADAPVQYNIPDIGSMGEAVREQYSRPAGFVDALKKEVFDGADRIDYGRDHNVARIAAYVIAKDQPNLMTIHFFSVDHYSHMQGRDGDSVRRAVLDADSSVGIVMDALKIAGIWDKTALIITGDHGFENVTTSVNPNVWLVRAGLITDVKTDDWKAQFFCVGGSAYLYLKDRSDKETLKKVRGMLDRLTPDEKKYFHVIDRAKLNAIGANPLVEFALSAENGGSFGNGMKGEAIKSGHGGTHGHFPDRQNIRTGYIICGPGVKKGTVIREMNQRDQAAIICKLLGLSMPTIDGKVPVGLLQ